MWTSAPHTRIRMVLPMPPWSLIDRWRLWCEQRHSTGTAHTWWPAAFILTGLDCPHGWQGTKNICSNLGGTYRSEKMPIWLDLIVSECVFVCVGLVGMTVELEYGGGHGRTLQFRHSTYVLDYVYVHLYTGCITIICVWAWACALVIDLSILLCVWVFFFLW